MKNIQRSIGVHLASALLALSLFLVVSARAATSMQTEYYDPNAKPAPAVSKPQPATKPSTKPGASTQTTYVQPALPPTTAVSGKNINDLSRFIAGLPPESDAKLAALAKSPEWTAYATSMNAQWPKFDYVKLSQIRIWTAKELGKARINTVFYAFSGPDLVYALNYFPQATTYILCGLEPVGDIPSEEKLQPLADTLGWLGNSVKTLFNAGYFVTTDMNVDLKIGRLQGTLPVLCLMLSRSGCRITSISTNATRAEIHFTSPAGGPARTAYYFSTDLSNGGFGGSFLSFLRSAKPDTAYVKSASYLMHEDGFSAVRNFLLAQCRTIVQDDSGIPVKYFDESRWDLNLYGVYTDPLNIFAKYNQPDLAALYTKAPVPALTFGVGYHWNYKDANLLVATAASKSSAKKTDTPPAPRKP